MCAYMDALFAGTLCGADRSGRAGPEKPGRFRFRLKKRFGALLGRKVCALSTPV